MGLLVPISGDGNSLSPRQASQAVRLLRRAEVEVFRHAMTAAAAAEMDKRDAEAAADALRASLDEELDLLDWGLYRAGNSAAKAELVSRKVAMLASINDRRLTRRFGR